MAFIYSCPKCRKILGTDTDIIPPSCPACGTRFDPKNLHANRSRDRWMHILVLTACAGVGGACLGGVLALKINPDSPQLGTFLLLGFFLGLILGFLGFKRYDTWRNGPM
jgi:hypothetical protein